MFCADHGREWRGRIPQQPMMRGRVGFDTLRDGHRLGRSQPQRGLVRPRDDTALLTTHTLTKVGSGSNQAIQLGRLKVRFGLQCGSWPRSASCRLRAVRQRVRCIRMMGRVSGPEMPQPVSGTSAKTPPSSAFWRSRSVAGQAGAGERQCRGAGDHRDSDPPRPWGLPGKPGSTLWNGTRENPRA